MLLSLYDSSVSWTAWIADQIHYPVYITLCITGIGMMKRERMHPWILGSVFLMGIRDTRYIRCAVKLNIRGITLSLAAGSQCWSMTCWSCPQQGWSHALRVHETSLNLLSIPLYDGQRTNFQKSAVCELWWLRYTSYFCYWAACIFEDMCLLFIFTVSRDFSTGPLCTKVLSRVKPRRRMQRE